MREKFGFLFDAAFDLVHGEIERLYNKGKEQQKIPPKLYQNLEKRAKMIDKLLAQNITTSQAMTVHVKSLFARCSNFDYLWFIRDLVRGMPESKIATKTELMRFCQIFSTCKSLFSEEQCVKHYGIHYRSLNYILAGQIAHFTQRPKISFFCGVPSLHAQFFCDVEIVILLFLIYHSICRCTQLVTVYTVVFCKND